MDYPTSFTPRQKTGQMLPEYANQKVAISLLKIQWLFVIIWSKHLAVKDISGLVYPIQTKKASGTGSMEKNWAKHIGVQITQITGEEIKIVEFITGEESEDGMMIFVMNERHFFAKSIPKEVSPTLFMDGISRPLKIRWIGFFTNFDRGAWKLEVPPKVRRVLPTKYVRAYIY
jgi:hypothetical protein